MKASEIRGKSADELQQSLEDLLREQFNLRMQQGSGQETKPSDFSRVRKDIARLKTVMNEQSAGGEA